ncbi:2,3-bisphosphoglycerate-independent phosphoglycerate mutase [Desulfurivibrio alkaliphilus]|uniref:2,3-bisphosphoglycerate-independent phosphoglycerate mutase n=1 Tax=Desulfurivibrio alkaliphilus (strain DSM 19089 / UNIQEM U267 / AHT2) TaxID=589865 RepID=D6Z192_DESAT|nr:2,3-bisphosphoglycerate-independent phosphoglycerate mutase [Desulfurivibrio alkaliphilus]ADH85347.1 phosphoglycerate mutase, 2,3-bisphosphoglycerate-independent [Desulfurivibrio alkaliphilus AHT 2]
MSSRIRPVMLAILDGWGEAPAGPGNAVHLARTPNMDRWRQEYPFTTLAAHNGAVGLPEGQMGNSEVGHLNIGAGRIVYQDFTRIGLSVHNGEFFANQTLNQVIDQVQAAGGALHLMGLLSDGGVHSHLDHLVALLELAARRGLHKDKVLVHAFMDGRDTPPDGGRGYMQTLLAAMERLGVGRVATVCGRYYAMDRDRRWDRVQLAWGAVVDGQGQFTAADPLAAVTEAYGRGETDEFIKPTVIRKSAADVDAPLLNDGDGVIFFNFRADRARQLTTALTRDDFDGFPRPRRPRLSGFATMTRYEKDFDLPVAFPPQQLHRILGEEVSRHGLCQLRIAETEKYAHVTYFFNGGREEPFADEERALIPSNREVATYDLKPEMSAPQVTEELLRRLRGGENKAGENTTDAAAAPPYALVILNFANGDMVGHSGVLPAAIKACETVDHCIGQVVEAFTEAGGIVLITADHGNAEEMLAPNGGPITAHSCNPVPLILIDPQAAPGTYKLRLDGSLPNLAPTILELMGLPVPDEMDSGSLLEK